MNFDAVFGNTMAGKAILGMAAAAAMSFTVAATPVDAATFTGPVTFEGNDCSGSLGTPPDCVLGGSPMIGKIDFETGGEVWTDGVFGNLFSLFSVTLNGDGTGTFSYTPGPTDPGITGFTVKGGSFFNVYTAVGPVFAGQALVDVFFSAPINPANDKPFGVSHIVFFDTKAPSVIPLPAAGWLLLTGMGGLALLRRRKTA